MALEHKNVQCTLKSFCFMPLFLFDHHECITGTILSHPHESKGLTLFKKLTPKSAKGGSYITPCINHFVSSSSPHPLMCRVVSVLLKFPALFAIITVGQKNQASPHMHHQYRFTKNASLEFAHPPDFPSPPPPANSSYKTHNTQSIFVKAEQHALPFPLFSRSPTSLACTP